MLEFDQMLFIFNIVSLVVYTLLSSVLQFLDVFDIKAPIMLVKKVLNSRYYLIISLIMLIWLAMAKC